MAKLSRNIAAASCKCYCTVHWTTKCTVFVYLSTAYFDASGLSGDEEGEFVNGCREIV